VRKVNLELIQYRQIPYHKIIINLKNVKKKVHIKIKSIPRYDEKKWAYSKIDTSFILKKELFLKTKKSINKINSSNFLRAKEYGFLDGYKSTLKYGGFGGEISYSFKSPNQRTEERGLTKYLNTCILILELGGFDEKKIKEFLGLEELPESCK